MIANITLKWPRVIEFGPGKFSSLKIHLKGAKRVFFLCDPPVKEKLDNFLANEPDLEMETMISTEVVPEPPVEALYQLIEPVRTFFPDVVVGIGGGSAMDLAKLLSVLFPGEQQSPGKRGSRCPHPRRGPRDRPSHDGGSGYGLSDGRGTHRTV